MRALITGITGQDGSYLAELLLEKGYDVYGLLRRSSVPKLDNIAHILDAVTLLDGDLLDQSSLLDALQQSSPDEIYNLAAQSHVGISFTHPTATAEINALGPVRLLEALRLSGGLARFYQASTSELFGKCPTSPQNENTPFHPRSPYGVAKLYAHAATINYREAYGMYTCCGILFNHESPRRGLDFVTRKITDGVAQIAYGHKDKLHLGNMDAWRDWGYAGDYVQAMWLMLQQDEPRDYVIATGETHSIYEFVKKACEIAGVPEYDRCVEHDASMYRPSDVQYLWGDASRARNELGWRPRVTFDKLVAMMVESDMLRYDSKKRDFSCDHCARQARTSRETA